MITMEARQAPESLAEMAHELAVLTGHFEALTEGNTGLLHAQRTVAIVDKMEEDDPDQYVAAFHGLTYAWIVAKMPHLESVLSVSGHEGSGRTLVALTDYRRDINVEFQLPRAFDHVDDEFAGRP